MTWLPAAAGGRTRLDRVFGLCPELYADYRTFLSHCWSRSQIDPIVLELCGVRVAHLMGCAPDGVVRAGAALDERDREVLTRASHRSGYVFALGSILSMGAYLLSHDGDLLFYGVFASLMISQLCEYGVQIFLYRTSV